MHILDIYIYICMGAGAVLFVGWPDNHFNRLRFRISLEAK